MTFSRKRRRHSQKRKHQKKGLFGGAIMSQTQIEALNEKIKAHEAQEFAKFEKAFDNDLNEL